MTEFNRMQTVKRKFFALRNGAVADALRKGGASYRIIFGLLLPQIADVARETGYDEELAEKLWANKTTRESLLLAPMLVDPQCIGFDRGKKMALEAPTAEVADVLCHRLLRRMPDAFALAAELTDEESSMGRYCAMRILWPFVYSDPERIKPLAEKELARNDSLTLQPARQILDEIAALEEL